MGGVAERRIPGTRTPARSRLLVKRLFPAEAEVGAVVSRTRSILVITYPAHVLMNGQRRGVEVATEIGIANLVEIKARFIY